MTVTNAFKPALQFLLTVVFLFVCFAASANSIQKSHFANSPDGAEIDLYTLTNAHGLICKVITWGGAITELQVPDRDGKLDEVVLGFAHPEEYLKNGPYFGAICGRVANRVANARFTLDGRVYALTVNNGTNQLHGGPRGFTHVLWHAEPSQRADAVSLRLTYTSPDGDEGYPGTVQAAVTYTLTDSNELRLEYEATTDKPTPVNLSNHTYWNLTGGGQITNQLLTINADQYTPMDAGHIPTGEIVSVKGTPLDFTSPTEIGSHLRQLPGERPVFDNNYVLNGGGKKIALTARVFDPASGRVLEVWSDQPGVQLYTVNFGNGFAGRAGQVYQGYAALCLESQYFPDYVNHPNFPQSILRPGKTYRQTTVWRFSTR